MYILDTMVVSELQKKQPHPTVSKWLALNEPSSYYLSVITLGEIQKGICREEKRNHQFAIRLARWLNELESRFGDHILPVSNEIAKEWGVISHKIGNSGVDNLIAATAKVHNLTVATRNIKHFEMTGVSCVNPWEW